MEFIREHALYFLLGIAAIFTFFWLYAFRKRFNAKWYHILAVTASHIFFGVLFVKIFAFLEVPERGYQGAMSLFGALFFVPLIYLLLAKLMKLDKKQLLDLMAVAMPFTLGCARINCLIAGCCKGQPIPFITDRTVLWPTRETELVFYVILITIFVIMIIKKKNYGQMYPLYMMAYGVFRFIIEFFRAAETPRVAGPFHLAHLWAVICLCVGMGIFFELKSRKSNKNKNKNKRS